jgi:spore coat protein H
LDRPIPWLPQARWKRWLVLFAIGGFFLLRNLLLTILTVILTVVALWQVPSFQGWVVVKMLRRDMKQPTELPPEPSLQPEMAARLATNAQALRSAAELFGLTNVWDVRLTFRSNQWTALGPNPVPPILHFMQPNGSVVLRNPKALRNGLSGVLGIDLPWSTGDVAFANAAFTNVGARFKGNGTFVASQRSYKRPFKIDLNKQVKSQRLAGRATLNFHNLAADNSYLSDALAYEFFREAGVPASRTAFARLRLTVEGRFADRLLGLYVLVENPDADWAREQFGVGGVALFKPVTYDLFKDLGDNWQAYEGPYDPKTKTDAKQQRRLIDLAKLFTGANDAELAARVGEFIDLDEFARFLACEVILSNYDGILSNGQNFLLYLDPRTDRFGFIPWDLDHCWGEFGLVGTVEQREQASVWRPWVGDNRFLERMLAAAPVRERYRRELERLLTSAFLPDRLSRRMDELAAGIRPFIAEESTDRLARFERALAGGGKDDAGPGGASGQGPAIYSHKRFFRTRAASVTEQLEGRAEGVVLPRKRLFGG